MAKKPKASGGGKGRGKDSPVTAIQREVLERLAEGKSPVTEKGRRVGSPLNSLKKKGLIEVTTKASRGKAASYRVTKKGEAFLGKGTESAGESVEEKPAVAPPSAGRGTALPLTKPKFVPVAGTIVWVRDFDGTIIKIDHWVRKVMPETQEALLSVRWGQIYKDLPQPFPWSLLVPRGSDG